MCVYCEARFVRLKGLEKDFWNFGLTSFIFASMSFLRPIAREIEIALCIAISFRISSVRPQIK